MKNRPTEPGHYYWWEAIDGKCYVASVAEDEDYYDGVLYDETSKFTLEGLEDSIYFKRWLGKAVPPRRQNEE